MRKLDVKEIHGYQAALGLELIKPEKLGGAQEERKEVGTDELNNPQPTNDY